jgi:putative FmdB family regulatory protein
MWCVEVPANMPLYEYECRQCGVHFERRQGVHDEPEKECPECGAAVRRVLFPVGVIFKGSGFYITDSRRPQPIGDSNGSKAKANGSDNGDAKESSPEPAPAPKSEPAKTSSAEPVGSTTA